MRNVENIMRFIAIVLLTMAPKEGVQDQTEAGNASLVKS